MKRRNQRDSRQPSGVRLKNKRGEKPPPARSRKNAERPKLLQNRALVERVGAEVDRAEPRHQHQATTLVSEARRDNEAFLEVTRHVDELVAA